MADSRSREAALASIRDLLVARRKSGHIWRPLPDHVRDKVLAMIHEGATVNQIVRATNINSATVHRWLRSKPAQKTTKPRVFNVDQTLPLQSNPPHTPDSVRLTVGSLTITVSASGRS